MRVLATAMRIAGRPVLVRSAATFIAIGLPAAIVFAPRGLEARDLVRSMDASPLVRAIVWLGWLALSSHATTAAFTAPGLTALRAARPERVRLLVALFALASIVQLPWAVLWLRGGGPAATVSAVTIAVAAAASAFALLRRRTLRSGATLALALSSALAGVPIWVQAGVGSVLAPIALASAWSVAPEHRTSARVWTRATASPLVALITVHLLRLARAERLRLLLATMIGAIGGAGLLTLRSDPSPRPYGRALAIMAVPLVLGSALFSAPLLDNEKKILPRLRVLRIRRTVIAAAFVIAIVAPTSAFAATAGVVAATAPVGGALALWAVVLGGTVGLWARRNPNRGAFAAGVALIAILGAVLAMELS